MEFIIHKQDGILINPQVLDKNVDALADGRWLFKAENVNKRTLPMNAYLHGVLIPEFRKALNNCGYDEVKNDDQAKRIMKSMFLADSVVNKQTGEMIPYVKDTHDLTTIEMSALFDEVIKFSAVEMNYQIPYPNEQMTML